MTVHTEAAHELARSTEPARASAAWSASFAPDGAVIAYVSNRSGSPRVWLRDTIRDRDRMLDTGAAAPQEVRWSIDGEWLAVLAAPGGSPRTEVWLVRADGSALRRVAVPLGAATFLGPWTHRPGVLALSCSASECTSGEAWLEHADSGRRRTMSHGDLPIVCDVDREQRTALVRRGARGARTLWTIDLLSDCEQQLVPRGGEGSTDLGRLAPDARIAYVRSNAGAEMHGLFAVDLRTRTTTLLVERADAELEDIILTADGAQALLLWNFAGRSEAELMQLASGARTPLALPQPVAHGGSFCADGRQLALTLEGPTEPSAIWSYDLPCSQWRRSAGEVFTGFRGVHPTLEVLRADDGLQITGWLYRARGRRGPGPTVLHLHGGPEAQERPAWNPLFQELAAWGISVFAPNIRGSSGFGRSFMTGDDRDKRWAAFGDVAACARFLVARGITTHAQLACAGRSYGGYLTLAMLVFQPELFVAGIDLCGMADLQTFYQHTEPFIARAAYPKYGHPVHDAALLRALSPIHHFDALRAPLLVAHGENDSNVPVEEAEQVVAAARRRAIPVEYLLFSDEGHELQNVDNRVRLVRRIRTWLSSILQP